MQIIYNSDTVQVAWHRLTSDQFETLRQVFTDIVNLNIAGNRWNALQIGQSVVRRLVPDASKELYQVNMIQIADGIFLK